jgi:hypothetical protein
MIDELTEDTFLLYAAKHYDNPNCHDVTEFYDDLKRFKYLKKLFQRYRTNGELKERLILNHIIVLNNIFGTPACSNMLMMKLVEYSIEIKPFLVLLNILPENVEFNGIKLKTSDIPMDMYIVEKLRKI